MGILGISTNDDDRDDDRRSTYSRTTHHSSSHRRESPPRGYFVRTPSHSDQRKSSPKGYFVRTPSHSGHGHSYRAYSASSARSRPGYIQRLIHRVRRMLRDLYYYARRHPVKVFMLVIMPLLTGGALHRLLAQFGIRLPPGLLKAFGGAPRGMEEFGFGGSGVRRNRYGEYERYRVRGERGGGGSGLGLGDVGSLINVAKMFM